MTKSHALVDLTLDSEDGGRTKAGSKSTQKSREDVSSKKDRGPQSQDHQYSQKRRSPNLYNGELRHSEPKHRTSINTRETAFDLTVDDEKSSKVLGEYLGRANPTDSRTQRAAAVSGKGDMTPTPQDAYDSESLDQPERSKSQSSKRRTTPVTRVSPVRGDSGRSVAFRPPRHISKSTPKDRPLRRSEPDGEDPMHKAHAENASQKSSPRPGSVPSLSDVNKTGQSSRDGHGELAPNSLRTTNTRNKPAAEVLFKSESPASGPTLKKSRRTVSSKKTPSGDGFGHESPRLILTITTNGTQRSRDGPLSAAKELTADLNLSAAVHDNTDERAPRAPSPQVHQQEPKDEQVALSKGRPDIPMFEDINIGNSISKAAGPNVSCSASCTGNGPSRTTGEASIPLRDKKSTVGDERAKRETASSRLYKDRVGSPTRRALELPEDARDRSEILSGAGVDGTKTMAAAMMFEPTLLSNVEGSLTAEPAIEGLERISESHMEQCIRQHLKDLHHNHEYFMKAWLGRARKSCDRRATAKRTPSSSSDLDHAAGSMTVPEKYVQNKSPFAEMKALGAPLGVKESQVRGHTGRLQQQILRLPKPVRPIEEVSVTMYTSDAVSVPPYLNYIPIRRNILAENDRSLKYYPYFGEDGPGKKSGLEKELEERFNNRIKHLPLRHWYAEQADKLVPYTTRYLKQVGCSVEAVLYLLLDTDHPIEPAEGSSWTLHKWYARCFATESVRTSKKWQTLFSSMLRPGQAALARAELACKAFYTVTKLSLWYIVRIHEITVNHLAQLQVKKDTPSITQGLHTYTDLGCLMCHVHDCPCHGEYEEFNGERDGEGKEAGLKDDSNSEDADSESDNGMTHNLRKRVVAEPHMLRNYRVQRGPVAYNDNDVGSVQDFLGMNDDGTISGVLNRTGDRGNSGFSDTELCSAQCFWKKTNRTAKVSEWSEVQLELLHALLPAYIASRRGPCMMTYAFEKPCEEVFNMMRSISSTVPAQDEMPTTLPQNGNGRPIPRRGWQYWQKNSVTHIHEERDPFRPCSHEGSCQDAACPCYKANITCEKSCQCANSCERRFRGCNCAQGNQVCWMSERCDCYQLNRECDPDLCGSCGAYEVLNPVNRYDEQITHRKCSNVYMQRGVPKRTLMGHSDIQGWGLYIGEDVKANAFLGEYKGEIVSKTEGDRRGAVYHYRGIEYLFGLNKTQDIDSTRTGNKMRFINNSKKHINCYPRKVLCNTVQRIGMYAKRDLVSGEELYFDYGYPDAVTKNFWDKGEPKMPAGSAAAAATAGPTKSKTTAVKQGAASSASASAPAKAEKDVARKRSAGPPGHGGARSGAGRKARAVKASAAPSGKRAEAEAQGREGSRAVAAEAVVDEGEEMDVIESDGDGDGEGEGDDDAASEVDPYALEVSESEDDSYGSVGEVEVEKGRRRGRGPMGKMNGRVGGSAQKRGWITRKENLKRKRGY